jgi:hypothetical protein
MRLKKFMTVLLALFFIANSMVMPVAATVSVDTTDEYSGGEEESDQAVTMTYTLSPDESEITDIRIEVESTTTSFIDFNSFSRTITGDADSQIEPVGDGVFEIDRIEPNQEITLAFEAYPTTIKQSELTMATVSVEYVQQGQSLEESTQVNADLSDSPWFRYQEATNGEGPSPAIPLLLGLLIGVLFGAGGAYGLIKVV